MKTSSESIPYQGLPLPVLIVCSTEPPMSWERFTSTHPLGSMALDGYVADAPKFDPRGPYYNANHHENVARLATLSTAQQLYTDISMGLDKPFIKDGIFSPITYVNDCDQDVCTSWFLLNNVALIKEQDPALERFVEVTGKLDASGGAYPYSSELSIIREQAWVFQPYTAFRRSGEMAAHNNTQYQAVIHEVAGRIKQHLSNSGNSVDLDTRYRIVSEHDKWKMVEEIGDHARMGALKDGLDAGVAVQQLPNERWRYTIWRRSEYIPFDIPNLLPILNEAEGCFGDMWGGATNFIGSPRVNGSIFNPQELARIVEDFIR